MARKSRKHKSSKQKSYSYTPPKRKSKSRKPLILGLIFCIAVVVVVMYSMTSQGGQNTTGSNKVLLKTSMGDITIELYDDMPITTGNFKNLVQEGVYDNNIFHRVIDEFMIQGGADPSIPAIDDEFTENNRNDRGTIAMANAGPNTGSSQFFINLVDNNYLDDKHPVFGRVIEGMEVVDAIGKVETGAEDKPLQDVKITEAQLIN